MKIKSLAAWQIFDSRGNPTVEAEMVLEGGARGTGMVPSGASTGQFEAVELRDSDLNRFRGKSVFKAIQNINEEIAAQIVGRSMADQRALDEFLIDLDGTPNKSRLGANSLLAVSMAFARATAGSRSVPLYESLGEGQGYLLPIPEIQIIGGGAHANWRTDVQDYMIIATGARSFEETLEITHNIYHAAGDLLKEQGKRFGVADEGGFWPEFRTNEEPLALIVQAIERAGYKAGKDAAIALDIAASDLWEPSAELYRFKLESRELTAADFVLILEDWCGRYPIVSIEDPFADTDWDGWEAITRALGPSVQLVGDDLFTTNLGRIKEGVLRGVSNAVLIKLNQIGTVTETMDAIRITQTAGWQPIVSARSGETEDAFISHLAVATNAGQLKVGSFSRSERMVKWNEILRISRHLGDRARFASFSRG